MRNRLAKNQVVRAVMSFEVTIVCLGFLFIQTLWGTFYQIEFGLYLAKETIFNSWFFTFYNWIPFPGSKLILWILSVNLLAATLFKLQYKWNKLGINIAHWGMMLLLFGSAITYHFAQESFLSLNEGNGSDVSADYHEWELAVWTQTVKGDSTVKEIKAYDWKAFKDTPLNLDTSHSLIPEARYLNARALRKAGNPAEVNVMNSSDIGSLADMPGEKDPANNVPGLIFHITSNGQILPGKILLYGGDPLPTSIVIGGERVYFYLRHKRYPLPILVELLDFKKQDHLGTTMARSFESRVLIKKPGFEREMVISMNKPLRIDDFTFFQASFTENQGEETSTFAIVQNPGRTLPYISSLIIGLGLVMHFLVMLFKRVLKQKPGTHS